MAPNPTRGRTTGTVAAVCAAVFADSLLYSVIVPVLPRYAERLGATPFAVGLLFASYAVALLAATPVLAAVSDRVGRRTPLLLGLVQLPTAPRTAARRRRFAIDLATTVLGAGLVLWCIVFMRTGIRSVLFGEV